MPKKKNLNYEDALMNLFSVQGSLSSLLMTTTPERNIEIQTGLQRSLTEISRMTAPKTEFSSTGTFKGEEALGIADEPQRDSDNKQLSVLTDIRSILQEKDPNYI